MRLRALFSFVLSLVATVWIQSAYALSIPQPCPGEWEVWSEVTNSCVPGKRSVDFSTLVGSVDFTTAALAVVLVAVGIVSLLVVISAVRRLFSFLRSL